MSKYKVEYRIVKKSEEGAEIQQSKKIVDSAALSTLINTIATQEGIEFFTVRVVKPKPELKPKEVKK